MGSNRCSAKTGCAGSASPGSDRTGLPSMNDSARSAYAFLNASSVKTSSAALQGVTDQSSPLQSKPGGGVRRP
ncbi:hypothetical protein B7P34_21895 [Streptosporangium nondiastaticum]|uniref:Uncharacterized protein n=1 Tax=Streptosporangium nondiastaticum TaxID=35764 RepID=A0A9X7JMX3_9ACTN|nr:hypothetical protein B7P34_21895 [Streptosporangium nondiastaticum]